MKNKFLPKTLLLCLIPAILAVACSEGAYTPTAATPAFNTGIAPNNGVYPNGVMPVNGINPNMGYNNGYNNTFNPGYNTGYMNNGYMNMMMPRPVLSWGLRLSTGFYTSNYMNYMNTSNCIPSNTYTTNCSQNTVRTPCPYTSSNNRNTFRDTDRTTYTTTTTSNTDNTRRSPCPYNVDRAPKNSSSNVGMDETTKVLPLSLINSDGQAVYERLAIKEVSESKKIKTRTSEMFRCMDDSSDSDKIHYACDFQIRLKDGVILKQVGIGSADQPEVFSGTPYKGVNLTVNATEDANIKLGGKVAEFLFKYLPGTAKEGKVDEASLPSASVKAAGQVKCYQSINAKKETVTGCVIRIKTDTGTALNTTI